MNPPRRFGQAFVHRLILLWLVVASGWVPAAPLERNVLVLYSYGRLLPAVIETDRGLRETLRGASGEQVRVYDEYFDAPRFGLESYGDTTVDFLRSKYEARRPDVIVAAGPQALRFLLENRARLFPGVPVVHEGIQAALIPPLPPGVVGVAHDIEVRRTLELALRLHPRVRRIVFVTGKAEGPDLEWDTLVRGEARAFAGRVSVEFLSGLPHNVLLRRLAELDGSSIVFTRGYFLDGEGRGTSPLDSVRDMAVASGAPIYSPFDTTLGVGVVGGFSRTFVDVGRQTGRIVNALLGGADPASMKMPERGAATLDLDWRQLRRWGIDERDVPADAEVHFRKPSIWEAYRGQVIAGMVILLLQAALILWLFAERFRRRRAERAVERQRFQLAHALRLAVAGELTAAIAHEINQPLGAILSNADAAELMLDSGADRRVELREILADIRRDDLRASEVIQRLRTLLTGREGEQRPFDVNELVLDAVAIVRSEAARRGVTLEARTAAGSVSTVGDRIQLQQVLINLILNASDAVAGLPDAQRLILVTVTPGAPGGTLTVTVRDRGRGIAEGNLSRVFESFFTTKGQGMGLGLSIARTLVEAHGGRIWAESPADGGALFCIELRQV
jgi:signal transduction histidine kinase